MRHAHVTCGMQHVICGMRHVWEVYATGAGAGAWRETCAFDPRPDASRCSQWFRKLFPVFMKYVTGGYVSEDEAGERLRWHWQAFVESREKLRARRLTEAASLQELPLKPSEPFLHGCRRILSCRNLELRHALVEHTRPRGMA